MSNYGKWYIYPEGPCLTQFFGIEIKPVYTKFTVFERKDFVLTSFPAVRSYVCPSAPLTKIHVMRVMWIDYIQSLMI